MALLAKRHPSLVGALLLLAVLLTALAPDHWGIPMPDTGRQTEAGHTHAHETGSPAESELAGDTHQRHCHESAATCSDVPLSSLSGLAFLAEWLDASIAGLLSLASVAALAVLFGRAVAVDTPPPRDTIRAARYQAQSSLT